MTDRVMSSAIAFVRAVADGLLDLIYPPKCVNCGELGSFYICDNCRKSISYLEPPLCARCGLPIDDLQCPECSRSRFAFKSARAVGVYEGALRQAIHTLKYSGCTVTVQELGLMMCDLLRGNPDFASDVELVIPMPIHRFRQRERGFNQSELLARRVAECLQVPLNARALVRQKSTRPQVELSVEDRARNVKGAFKVTDEKAVSGKILLLIDDVLTTGSTANEATEALLSAGAHAVRVLTLARSC